MRFTAVVFMSLTIYFVCYRANDETNKRRFRTTNHGREILTEPRRGGGGGGGGGGASSTNTAPDAKVSLK